MQEVALLTRVQALERLVARLAAAALAQQPSVLEAIAIQEEDGSPSSDRDIGKLNVQLDRLLGWVEADGWRPPGSPTSCD